MLNIGEFKRQATTTMMKRRQTIVMNKKDIAALNSSTGGREPIHKPSPPRKSMSIKKTVKISESFVKPESQKTKVLK
jgi:hypothetical protein